MTVPHVDQEGQQASVKQRITQGIVNYVEKPQNGEALWTRIHQTGPGGLTSSNLKHDERQVEVCDIRTAGKKFTLRDNGFTFEKLEVPENIDWQDPQQVQELYYPAAEQLIQRVTGASRVHIFDHTLRQGNLVAPNTKTDSAKRGQPQGSCHVDYDHRSGIDRLDELLPDEASKLRETPFAIIQIWRPIKGPVRSSPLGMIDVSTVERDDMTPYDIIRPERLGRNFAIHFNPKHRWWYSEGINTDEAYVFVCYHSQSDGTARFTPHCGFRDLSVGDSGVPRESVELRSYVFWEHEAPQEVRRQY